MGCGLFSGAFHLGWLRQRTGWERGGLSMDKPELQREHERERELLAGVKLLRLVRACC